MGHHECTYCSGHAIGIDEDGALTCGDAGTCAPVEGPLPNRGIIEASGDDDENEGEAGPEDAEMCA